MRLMGSAEQARRGIPPAGLPRFIGVGRAAGDEGMPQAFRLATIAVLSSMQSQRIYFVILVVR